MAVPDTIDTSCSADGPPSRTTIGGRLLATARRLGRGDTRPVADELDLERERHAGPREDRLADRLGEAADVRRGPLLVVDDEVGVLLGHDRAADPRALEARPRR